AGRHILMGIADPDADAAVDRFAPPGLGMAIALDALDGEADEDALAVAIVAGREIAEDAVPDPVALGLDPDRLGDVEAGVGGDLDVAIVGDDPLALAGGPVVAGIVGLRFLGGRGRGEGERREQHRGQGAAHGQACAAPNFTTGAVWIEASVSV